jgi:hypothetical protein
MKRLAIVGAVVALVALCSVAFAAATLSGTYKTKVHTSALGGELNGTWTIDFKSGGYTVSDQGKVAVRGKNSINGTKISFTDTSGAEKCPGTGRYTFKLKGKALKFTKVKESAACAGRLTVLSGAFTKIG